VYGLVRRGENAITTAGGSNLIGVLPDLQEEVDCTAREGWRVDVRVMSAWHSRDGWWARS
jgi:hypothetical protein